MSLEDKLVFQSMKNASEYYGFRTFTRIGMSCKDKSVTACGKHWMIYDEYLKENNLTESEAQKSLFFIVQNS